MEDLILNALYQNPGITPERIFAILPTDFDLDHLRVAILNIFRHTASDEAQQLPQGMTLDKLALQLDQLIGLAIHQDNRGAATQPKEARHV